MIVNFVFCGIEFFDLVLCWEFCGENEEFKEGWWRLVFWFKCDYVLNEIVFGDGYNDFGEIVMNVVVV